MGERMDAMIKIIIGMVIGGLAGYAVYRYIGCATGACPITSNPLISTIFGAIIGALAAGAGAQTSAE